MTPERSIPPDRALVLTLTRQGRVIESFGSFDNYDGQFVWPHAVAVATDGKALTSDWLGCMVATLQRVLDTCVRLFRVVAEHLIFRCALPHDARRRPHLTHSLEPMTLRSRRVAILAVRYEYPVTVEFKGGRQTATFSAASDGAAAEQARTAACGPLASGMDESIGCARRPPAHRSCHTL